MIYNNISKLDWMLSNGHQLLSHKRYLRAKTYPTVTKDSKKIHSTPKVLLT
jgi:hypothetical protein